MNSESPSQKPSESEGSSGPSDQDSREPKPQIPPAARSAEAQSPPPPHCDKKTYKTQRDWLDYVELVMGGIGLIVLIGYTTFAALQWCEMRKATNAAKQAAEAATSAAKTAASQLEMSERPWVYAQISIDGPFTYNINGANVPLKFELRNTGPSPALGTLIITTPVVGISNTSKAPSYIGQICKQADMQTGGEALFPNSPPIPWHYDIGIPKEWIEKAHIDTPGGMIYMSVVACIAYRPPFNNQLIYHTGYTLDVMHIDEKGRLVSSFKMGEPVEQKQMRIRLYFENGILAN